MTTRKQRKWYAVFEGRVPGLYDTWKQCREMVDGYAGARYKSFADKKQALSELARKSIFHHGKSLPQNSSAKIPQKEHRGRYPACPFYCTDAACDNPAGGNVEYRFVRVESPGDVKNIFACGPFEMGSNNVGEYIALVRAIQWLCEHDAAGMDALYSDSRTAISWVSGGRGSNSSLGPRMGQLLRSELAACDSWITTSKEAVTQANRRLLHWNTPEWGEIPADYGRK